MQRKCVSACYLGCGNCIGRPHASTVYKEMQDRFSTNLYEISRSVDVEYIESRFVAKCEGKPKRFAALQRQLENIVPPEGASELLALFLRLCEQMEVSMDYLEDG